MQIIEKTSVFSKWYDILGFSNSLYLPQITQYIFFIFLIIENFLTLLCHSFHNHLEKMNLYTLINFYLFNIKSITPIQKYPHIIESYACILY